MRDRASLVLFVFIILLIIILAQNGTLGTLWSSLTEATVNFYPTPSAPGVVATVRPLVFSTAAPVNNVFPTPWGPTAYVPPMYAPTSPVLVPTAPGNTQAGGTSGSISPSGQCIVPNGWVPYTIQSGETLATIAAAYNLTVQQLAAANCLDNPDMIYAGQIIAVPGS